MKKSGKYSFGMGDRFGHQGSAQLAAIIEAGKKGIEITPVWNKSNREHMIIGTEPGDVRKEADEVTRKAGFNKPYFVDADHINMDNVDRFIESSDFFTIDVASYIGKLAGEELIRNFVTGSSKYTGELKIQGIKPYPVVTDSQITNIAKKYLFAAQKAGEIYRKIEAVKGKDNFVAEVSMDEVPVPQTPVELFFILKMLGEEKIPAQTIAPKFSGRFNKGVDYVGDPLKFAAEFEADLMVIDMAVKEFGLPANLKMSVHSGSDKFAIYPYIGSIVKKHNKGLHLKTAGTTWLEEVIGLAESGGDALAFVKEVYAKALEKTEELCAPYADVIDINISALPSKDEVSGWNSSKFAAALRHVPGNPDYNPNMRQLIHVGYKLAAMKMDEFFRLLDANEKTVSQCVYENMYNRHICRLFDIK
ncbi:MAG TPA: tagaturonate epimerase family protein [Bacteroidales bacterium]|nr:tagaturonate epimerase family protein [Bacteroidales bacterium]HOX76254.1 tagaturonate epimerase family protein [Bacteroidales bacterium]HPM87167.1 tagaturonate epimerase family protein [Bacteroidales bacterium]HQM69548.1 tagaturonate epimerase family protein [Bacteroidales bacterium]